jgi:hypothetical protein
MHVPALTLRLLTDFRATANETEILLEWQTAIELDNAGFHLWRATGEGWKYGDYSTVIRLTEQLIAAQGNSSVYSYRDTNVESGMTYYYGLEDIDLYGQSTFHWDLIDVGTLSKVGEKSQIKKSDPSVLRDKLFEKIGFLQPPFQSVLSVNLLY